MNTKLETLRAFLADAHRKGSTDCETAEKHLASARAALHETKIKTELDEIRRIIGELEQIHTVCTTMFIREEDDDLVNIPL